MKMIINHAEMPLDFMPVDLGRLGSFIRSPLPRRERTKVRVSPNKAHFKSNMRRNLDMPDEIKELAQAPRVSLLNVLKNVVRGFNQKIFVVRGFSLAPHDPEGSYYEDVESEGDKRSMVDVGEK